MTAAALARSRGAESGLRRTDPRRDLAGVAQVVQTAFAGQLDSTGQRMLRDMRLLGRGRAGWVGRWVASSCHPAPPRTVSCGLKRAGWSATSACWRSKASLSAG